MTGYDLGLTKTANLVARASGLLAKVKKPAMYLGLGGGGLYLGQKGYEEKVKAANLRAKLRSLQEQSQAPQASMNKEAVLKEFFGSMKGLVRRGAASGAAKVVRPNVRTGSKVIGEIPKVPGTAMVSAHNLHLNPPVPAAIEARRAQSTGYQNPQWTRRAAAQRGQLISSQASRGVNPAPTPLSTENAPLAIRRKFNLKPGFGTGLTAGLGAWGLASAYNRGDAQTDPNLQFAQG